MDSWERCACPSCISNPLVQLQTEGYQASALNNVATSKSILPPPWFDPEKFKRGQEFFKINFHSIFVTNLVGLFTILHVNNIVSVLTDTERTSTIATATYRYLSTMRHLYSWYTSNPFMHGDKANKSIKVVRQLHRSSLVVTKHKQQETDSSPEEVHNSCKEVQPLDAVNGKGCTEELETMKYFDASLKSGSKAIEGQCSNPEHLRKKSSNFVQLGDSQKQASSNGKLNCPQCLSSKEAAENTSPIWEHENKMSYDGPALGCKAVASKQRASQVDMVATQWAFCALAVLKAKEVGIAESSMDLLPGFLHFWRTMGYLMGVEDRFNLCQPVNNDADCSHIKSRMTALQHRLLAPALARAEPKSRDMADIMLLGAQKIVPAVSPEVFTWYSLSLLDIPDRPEIKGLPERKLLAFQIYIISDLMHQPVLGPAVRWLLNFILLLALTFADNTTVIRCVETLVLVVDAITWLLKALGLGYVLLALQMIFSWMVWAREACSSVITRGLRCHTEASH